MKVGWGGADATLNSFFEMSLAVLDWPPGRFNEENAKRPGDPHGRFQLHDLIPQRDFELLTAMRRTMALHLAEAHPRPAEPEQPGSLAVPVIDKKGRRSAEPHLDQTDVLVLRFLRGKPEMELITRRKIEQGLVRSPKSLDKNLAYLTRLQLIANVKRKGYCATPAGRQHRL